MRFNFKGQIEVEPDSLGGNNNIFLVTKGHELFLPEGQYLTLLGLKKNFTPADCNALNLVDPNRTERLCQPIIGGTCKPAPGGIDKKGCEDETK